MVYKKSTFGHFDKNHKKMIEIASIIHLFIQIYVIIS